jgi:hypothetical protein
MEEFQSGEDMGYRLNGADAKNYIDDADDDDD